MGSKKNTTISGTDDNIKIVKTSTPESQTKNTSDYNNESNSTEPQTEELNNETIKNGTSEEEIVAKSVKKNKTRSKKYTASKAKVDKTKKYELEQAVELVQKLSYSKFDGTVEAHLIVKEAGISTNFSFPHSTGKSIKAVIFSEKIAEAIAAGQIDFDVLLATPQDMPKLTKFARVLGPKGLMPNPKNGTLSTNPEAKKKELEAGKITIKAERKAPLMHVGVGKVSMKTTELTANIQALLDSLPGKVIGLALSATMSPSIKVVLEK